ncbi:MAG: GspE/PulE family protein [Candidatus Muirbacterium halophilum]|nr:GspE/PulE family protein [Candidatus Muirbacterium halophilum]MCK9475008.1 GspE/PulE family protein [Candidatus Muirbacterium halophilum]
MKNRLEDFLVENGIISNSQLNWAKLKLNDSSEPLYKILIKEGLISEKNYFSVLAQLYEKEFINIEPSELNKDLIQSIPLEIIQKYYFIPVEKNLNGIKIATFEPNNFFMIQEIEEMTGYKIEVIVSTPTDILRARREFNIESENDFVIETLENIPLKKVAQAVSEGYSMDFDEKTDLEDYDIHNTDAPVVVLVNKLIFDAVKNGATDIHIESFEDYLKVRYRVDGMLKKIMEIEKSAQDAVITRLKIISDLDITERFVAQDGRFKLRISEDDIDFRITFLPSMYGENISIRIFNKKVTPLTFSEIGMNEKQIEIIESMLKRKYGLVLIVGPTGSGKTTTLYTMINYLNSENIKIVTIEDPVEYRLEGIHQIPVRINREDESKSLTFAKGLKAILRQDPNVIMIGEIRDAETAEIAINAALTGHLVFSTLHANTTVDVISRLKHLGIDSELVSDALSMVVAQRLCRKICKKCGNDKKNGCEFCKYSGFSGRIGVFELLNVTQEIKEIIASDMAGVFIRKQAEKEEYWRSLEDDAKEKNEKGIISKEEYNSLIIY